MDDAIWRLPGPFGLLTQVTREIQRGRHVGVALPTTLLADELFRDGLLTALHQHLTAAGEQAWVVNDPVLATNPLAAVARALVFDDDPPCLVAELLDHPEAAGKTAMIDCAMLDDAGTRAVSHLLARTARESRPRPRGQRPRLIVIGSHRALPDLPDGHTDVTFQTVWWWGRLSRWDVASHIAPLIAEAGGWELLQQVRLETILELCHWDLDLAQTLAGTWDGDPTALRQTLATAADPPPPGTPARTRAPVRVAACPGEDLLQAWDDGLLDQWHDRCSPQGQALLADPAHVTSAIWSAQARILLPWIERMRGLLIDRLHREFGPRQVQQAWGAVARAPGVSADDPPAAGPDGVLEVGPLFLVTKDLLAGRRPALRDAAWQLKETRNRLAHLNTLTLPEQRDLASTAAALRE